MPTELPPVKHAKLARIVVGKKTFYLSVPELHRVINEAVLNIENYTDDNDEIFKTAQKLKDFMTSL